VLVTAFFSATRESAGLGGLPIVLVKQGEDSVHSTASCRELEDILVRGHGSQDGLDRFHAEASGRGRWSRCSSHVEVARGWKNQVLEKVMAK
jgi:hypothetical protein